MSVLQRNISVESMEGSPTSDDGPSAQSPEKKTRPARLRGKSERAYAALLNRFVREARLPVQIRSLSLEHAGDPLSRVKLLLKKVGAGDRQFQWMGILLDSDQIQGTRAHKARRLARECNINLIWQNPCHEELLLKHMPGQEKIQPANCIDAERKLIAIWREYQKPMTANQLSGRIHLEDVQQVARVEPDLKRLLKATGLPLSTR